MKEVKVAIAGLGRVGSKFLQILTSRAGSSIRIIAAVEANPAVPGVKIAEERNIKVYREPSELVKLGDDIDVIFDLTGSPEFRKALRSGLAESHNRHTVVAPEVMAFLIWDLIASGETFPDNHDIKGY